MPLNPTTMVLSRGRLALLTLLLLAVVVLAFVSLSVANDVDRRQAQLDSERRLAETRHGIVEYVSWGAGPAVLVIHGAGGGFDQGRLLAEALGGEGYRWIAVSRFGYLGSDLPDDASVAAQAQAFTDLLDHLRIERAHILAMSGGVPPALKFAERFPQRTGRMVLLSPAPFTPFKPDVGERPIPSWMYAALLGSDTVYWLLKTVARRSLEEAFDARAELRAPRIPDEEAFVRRLVDTFLPASKRVAGVLNEGAAVDPSLTYGLNLIDSTALIVHAADDRLNPFAVGQALAAGIPDAEFIGVETGGHLLLGHHAALRERIAEHLAAAR